MLKEVLTQGLIGMRPNDGSVCTLRLKGETIHGVIFEVHFSCRPKVDSLPPETLFALTRTGKTKREQ